jgi:Nuclease-related domain
MPWPRLRHRRPPPSLAASRNGTDAVPPSGTASGSGAAGTSQSPARDQAPGDVAFWGWARRDGLEPDDPADAFAPDRPEYTDGPDDPRYAGTDPDPGRNGSGPRGAQGPPGPHGVRQSWEPVVTPVSGEAGEPRREGIGQHLGNLAHLSADPRMRAWQRRAIIAIVIGVVVAILVNWQFGLTLAVLAAIADTVYWSRRVYEGRSGIRLTRAQRKTRRQLGRLERAGYRSEHCLPIPGSEDQIDHLVVGPAGVFAIDSEDWDRRLIVRTKSGKQLWHGPYSMKDRLEHARWESERAAELLSGALGTPVTVRPAMAVYGPRIPWDVATIRDVDVFSGPRLRKYLRRQARLNGSRPLSEDGIARIDKAARTAFGNGGAR